MVLRLLQTALRSLTTALHPLQQRYVPYNSSTSLGLFEGSSNLTIGARTDGSLAQAKERRTLNLL